MTPRLEVHLKVTEPPSRKAGVKVADGRRELVDKLKNEAKVI